MYNIESLYFLEEPIDTDIGQCRFFKVKEYWKAMQYGEILSISKNDLLEKAYDKIPEKKFNEMIDKDLLEIIKSYNDIFQLNTAFSQLFSNLFKDDENSLQEETKMLGEQKEIFEQKLAIVEGKDVINLNEQLEYIKNRISYLKLSPFDRISNMEQFDFYRKLIKDMNHISFEKPIINEEIAYYDKLEQINKERKGEVITFRSLVLNVGLYKQNVLDLSIYSLYAYFDTITNNKNYDTGNLFKTVSTERMDIKPWYTDSSIKKTELNESDVERIKEHGKMVEDDPTRNGIIKDI